MSKAGLFEWPRGTRTSGYRPATGSESVKFRKPAELYRLLRERPTARWHAPLDVQASKHQRWAADGISASVSSTGCRRIVLLGVSRRRLLWRPGAAVAGGLLRRALQVSCWRSSRQGRGTCTGAARPGRGCGFVGGDVVTLLPRGGRGG